MLTRERKSRADRHPQSALERRLGETLDLLLGDLPRPAVEYRFHPTRRWRFDFAWPALRLAVEIEGGEWNRGRHTRPRGFADDCEKYNAAAVSGWLVMRFTGGMVRGQLGKCCAEIIQAIRSRMK